MPFLDHLVPFCSTFSLAPSRYKLLLRAAHGDVSLPLRTAVPTFAFPYLHEAPLSHRLHLLTPDSAQESRSLPVPCSKAKSPPPWQLLGALGHQIQVLLCSSSHGSHPPSWAWWSGGQRRTTGEGEAARRRMIGANSCQKEGAWSLLFILWEDRSWLPGRGEMKAVGCQPASCPQGPQPTPQSRKEGSTASDTLSAGP